MANANKVSGLTPVKYLSGVDWDGRANVYVVDSGQTDALFVGDPVKLSGSGDANGVPGVVLATAGATCVGAVIGVGTNPNGPWVDPNRLDLVSAPATKATDYYVLVVDDPNVIFEIQEGGAGSNLAKTSIGLNADFVAASPATGVKVSAFYLNNNGIDTTSTRNLKVLGLARKPDNAIGTYAKWNVLINNHSFRTGVTGV